MKKVSLFISMLVLAIISFNAQDCNDFTETNGTDNEPGLYGIDDQSIDYSGNNQVVELGVYGFFSGWDSSSQADQTLFTVNGSDPIALSEINYFCTYVSGVCITLNTVSLNDEYLSNATSSWTSGTVKFTGAIENITMTQFESGLLFSCVEELETIVGCDYQFEGDDPGFDGYIVTNTYPFSFSGENQQVRIGYFDYVSWENQGTEWPSDASHFSVNGSEMFELGTIYNNQPFSIGDVTVTVDTTSIPVGYNVPEGMYSGTIIFEGEINLIHTYQVESGIKFICVGELEGEGDCIDYTETPTEPEFEGIYLGVGEFTQTYIEGTQLAELGIYGLFGQWNFGTGEFQQADQTYFSVNDGEDVSLETILTNLPYTLDEVTIYIDTNSLNLDYGLSEFWTSGIIFFNGEINSIKMTQFESGLLYSCATVITESDCQDFTIDGNDPEFPGLYGDFDATIPFDGTNQMVSMGIYGVFNDWGPNLQQSATFFTINGGDLLSLEYIQNNAPLDHEGFIIDLNIISLNDEYLSEAIFQWTSGTIIFSGAIDEIIMTQSESGMLFACTELILEPEDCIDYTEENDDPNAPGIYLVEDDYTMNYDSTYQEVSLGIYGFFDWSNIGSQQADQTLFSVNGSESVSLEEIYLTQPYILDGIEITVDTTALNDDYPLADYWPSGTIMFTGHISEVVMTQFESGLLFSCVNSVEEECECEECACQIDADFNYVNISNYYSFVSSGTGSEYSWDFGDGSVSSEENPTHQYSTPGGYEVCFTNFNLTDTCSITICKSILFMAITPEAHIITPNGDGFDDEVKIYCNNVTVYNRNGIVVAEILDQEYWDGTDGMSIVLPMGEYILKCNENEVIQKITIIR